jgi:hypothetical protein
MHRGNGRPVATLTADIMPSTYRKATLPAMPRLHGGSGQMVLCPTSCVTYPAAANHVGLAGPGLAVVLNADEATNP